MFVWGWTPFVDPDPMLVVLHVRPGQRSDPDDPTNYYNDANCCDPEYDELYEQQKVELDPDKRQRDRPRDAHALLRRTRRYVVLYTEPDLQAYRDRPLRGLACGSRRRSARCCSRTRRRRTDADAVASTADERRRVGGDDDGRRRRRDHRDRRRGRASARRRGGLSWCAVAPAQRRRARVSARLRRRRRCSGRSRRSLFVLVLQLLPVPGRRDATRSRTCSAAAT